MDILDAALAHPPKMWALGLLVPTPPQIDGLWFLYYETIIFHIFFVGWGCGGCGSVGGMGCGMAATPTFLERKPNWAALSLAKQP